MHRFALTALLLLSCIPPVGESLTAPDGLELALEQDVVQFFEAHYGSVKNCPDCVSFEEVEGTTRSAYFIELVESCRLTRRDVEGFTEANSDPNYFVRVLLNESGEARYKQCVRTREPNPQEEIRSYLIVVNGRSAGVELSFRGRSIGAGLFFYGAIGRAVASYLRPSAGPRSGP